MKTAQPLSAADFDGLYDELAQVFQLATALSQDGSAIKTNKRPGESAYVYANNAKAGDPDKLTIMSRQKINGIDRLVTLSCVLR